MSIIAAATVGIAILAAAAVCYFVVRGQLRSQIDSSLRAQMQAVRDYGGNALQHGLPGVPASAGGPVPYAQVVLPDGQSAGVVGITHLSLPVSKADRRIATTQHGTNWSDVVVGQSDLRVLTFPFDDLQAGAIAVQIARPLNSVNDTLSNLRLFLGLVLLGGVLVAGTLGRLASRRVLRPLKEVEQTAHHIAETDDLSNRIRVHADDEVGRLASRFNQMLDRLQGSRDALDESTSAQRQLIADASHELRTPVTSLRTNIEVLLDMPDLDPAERRSILSDVVEQSEELTALVNDLIELARGTHVDPDAEEVRLDQIAADCVARAQLHGPGLHIILDSQPAVLNGVAERLARAINNLLDNAARHAGPSGEIEIHAGPHGVVVRDHGHGIDPEDLPHVFDRFYRGLSARGRPGSGLGLSIVRQVTEQHGGTVSVANAPDGGAVFTLWLPATALAETQPQDLDHPRIDL